MTRIDRSHRTFFLGGISAAVLVAVVAACSATTKEKPILEGGKCALIPPHICAQLTPGTSTNEAGLRYFAPNVDFKKYKRIMIPPVVGFGAEVQKLTGEQENALINYLYDAMKAAFEKSHQLAEEPAPDVIKIQFAITDVEASTPVLRSVSMGLPQARLVGTVKYLFTGSYPFVGGAQGEAVGTDSVTGQILFAGVDKRLGGAGPGSSLSWKWEDAERAMTKWTEIASARMTKLFASGGP